MPDESLMFAVNEVKKNVRRVTQETQLVNLKYEVIDEEMPKFLTKKQFIYIVIKRKSHLNAE